MILYDLSARTFAIEICLFQRARQDVGLRQGEQKFIGLYHRWFAEFNVDEVKRKFPPIYLRLILHERIGSVALQ